MGSKLTLKERLQLQYGIYAQDITWFNSLYLKRVAARIVTPTGTYKLKRFKGSDPFLKNLYVRHASVQQLDLPHFPNWYKTKHSHAYFVHHRDRYYLTDWVEGRAFATTEQDACALGQTLSRVHSVPNQSAGFHQPNIRERVHLLRAASETLPRIADYKLPSDVVKFLTSESQSIQETLDEGIQALERLSPSLSAVICHGDVTVPNILFPGHRAALIDWERVNLGFAMEEVAKAVMNTCQLQQSVVSALLQGYQMHAREFNSQAFYTFLTMPREVVYLLRNISRRGPKLEDKAQWQLVMSTWADRKRLFAAFS